MDMACKIHGIWSDPTRIVRLKGEHQEILRGGLNAFVKAYRDREPDDLTAFEDACKADLEASKIIFQTIVDEFQRKFQFDSLYDKNRSRDYKKGIDSVANRRFS